MGVVINEEKQHAPIPVAEQTRLIEYVFSLVKESTQFRAVPANLNFVGANSDCVGVQLDTRTYKTSEYIDGSYEAQISFWVVYHKMLIASAEERLRVLDVLNSFGEYLASMQEFTISIPGVDIYGIVQSNSAGLVKRYENGGEDNGSLFVLSYEKN